MNLIFALSLLSDVPAPIAVTVSVCCLVVLLLAGFVLYMWLHQERSADVAREVNRLTEAIGAGIVNFIARGEGKITYASAGFYEMTGFSKDVLKEKYDRCFYRLLDEETAELFRTADNDHSLTFNKEIEIETVEGKKWVLIKGKSVMRKGRIVTVSAVVVDISENKKLVRSLTLEQERYRVATELANDVIFSYSVVDDTLKLADNFREFYGGNTLIPDFSKNRVWEKGYIHRDDTEKVAELIRIITIKESGIDQQIRVKDANDKYIWCRLICVPIPDETNERKEYVGKLINIDMHKKQLGLLEKKAMRDPLTGAFNKEYTRVLIDRYIEEHPENPGMLLLVDIDKFKNINDTYGHLMGDNVIIEVVNQVSAAFRSNDIVGRIGGDEFVVFVCNVRNPEDQLKQARKLHEVLRQPVVKDGVTVNKSASIGIAVYPDHGSDYEQLASLADKALYRVKGSGRDSFIIYDPKDFEGTEE